MKKYFTLLLMLPVFLFGQKDTLKSKWTDVVSTKEADPQWFNKYRSVNTLWDSNKGVWSFDEVPIKMDTIQIIMLVCDTLKRSTGVEGWNSIEPTVWWKPGFMVYEMQWGSIPCNSGNSTIATTQACFGWYREKFITHLDRRKKPLDSWIVVWMVKELN